LLEAADPYWRTPIFFALMTGCRQGEIWAMERDQVDLENAMVRIDRASCVVRPRGRRRSCYRTGLMSGSWTGWLMVIAGLISWDPALEGWSGRST
jgi:integrase